MIRARCSRLTCGVSCGERPTSTTPSSNHKERAVVSFTRSQQALCRRRLDGQTSEARRQSNSFLSTTTAAAVSIVPQVFLFLLLLLGGEFRRESEDEQRRRHRENLATVHHALPFEFRLSRKRWTPRLVSCLSPFLCVFYRLSAKYNVNNTPMINEKYIACRQPRDVASIRV